MPEDPDLCDLLCQYRLGVEVHERIEHDVSVRASFLDEFGEASA